MYGASGKPKPFSISEIESQLAEYGRQDLNAGRAFVVAALVWPDGQPTEHHEGHFIGTARLHSIRWPECKAALAIGFFDRRFWSRGYGTEATRLLLRYGFEDLLLHRIELRVLAFNIRDPLL
jgi:RimJ/RimL family protein N-acetyltransferase